MCLRRTLVIGLAVSGTTLFLLALFLVFTSPTFICSVKAEPHCTGTCVWSCAETCFCTTNNHEQATVALVPGLFSLLPLVLSILFGCDSDPLPWYCCCVRENPPPPGDEIELVEQEPAEEEEV
jgi:hypothetical protein